MGARENLQKLADRKAQEISDLERQVELARAYLQAIQDSIRALPREAQAVNGGEERPTGELRAGSFLAKAKEAIQNHGKPLHVTEILAAIGVENTKDARVSLVGSLGAYVRKGSVFTRPAPNTFGLAGMKLSDPDPAAEHNLPPNFGRVAEGD